MVQKYLLVNLGYQDSESGLTIKVMFNYIQAIVNNILYNYSLENEDILEEFYEELDWVKLSHSIITLRSQVESLLKEQQKPSLNSEPSNASFHHRVEEDKENNSRE